MGAMDLSVQVLNIPSKTTQEDLITFFSYCGSVDEIKLKRSNNGNQTQEALVTFRQPYARQTALLLNDATISGNRVRVLPVEISETSPISNGSLKGKHGGFIHSSQSVLKTIASKSYEAMNKAKELDGQYGVSQRTRSAAGQVVSGGTVLFSGLKDKALKLGGKKGEDNAIP